MKARLSTIRVRLTLLYAGLFFVTSTALAVAGNLLLAHALHSKVSVIAGKQLLMTARTPGSPSAATSPTGLIASGPASPAGPVATDRGTPQLDMARNLGDSLLSYQWTVTLLAVAALAVVGGAVGWWLAGRVLRPVRRVTATARQLSLSTLHERISLTGPQDELRELADTFDAMLARLERAADGQRRFAANASHELRTPLAIQRAAIEIGLQDASPEQVARMRVELLAATERTERLIDGLMILAQGERGPDRVEPLDLADLARDAVEQHRSTATQTEVHLHLALTPAPATGDPVLLTRLIANLVDNAVRHNHPGGTVTVSTTPHPTLTVTNTGPAIPAQNIPDLFEPFHRLPHPRTARTTGAGLGLSIVAAIAGAHGARVEARPHQGGGLTVEVTMATAANDDHLSPFDAARGRGPHRGYEGAPTDVSAKPPVSDLSRG